MGGSSGGGGSPGPSAAQIAEDARLAELKRKGEVKGARPESVFNAVSSSSRSTLPQTESKDSGNAFAPLLRSVRSGFGLLGN